MRFSTLPQWLEWQEKLHFTEIDPGLARIGQVWEKMQGQTQLPFKVVTIAGTNGKGSSVAMTSSILMAAGYRTGTYTSPHLLAYNERIAINGTPCSDEQICASFARIDQARDDISLTYFEFATLAAADLFRQQEIDIAVLEVGMGGRLDAVNLFDADVALITPIGLDHTAWLGDTREKIAYEKAGIIRAQTPVVCSESEPPHTLIDYANSLQAPIYKAGMAYRYSLLTEDTWSWQLTDKDAMVLPYPALVGDYQLQNAAAVIQVCYLLREQGMLIDDSAISDGLKNVVLAGRFQEIRHEDITIILDVTHNQQGAENLQRLLSERNSTGNTYAVLAMLKDKDCQAVTQILQKDITHWFFAGLDGSRGMDAQSIAAKTMQDSGQENYSCHTTVIEAYEQALLHAHAGDRILVFGSFHTVEAVMRVLPEFQNRLKITAE
jgi:dihydrofolate synthase / folylpolyglutamate synthase